MDALELAGIQLYKIAKFQHQLPWASEDFPVKAYYYSYLSLSLLFGMFFVSSVRVLVWNTGFPGTYNPASPFLPSELQV
jgi:hypothetical protein